MTIPPRDEEKDPPYVHARNVANSKATYEEKMLELAVTQIEAIENVMFAIGDACKTLEEIAEALNMRTTKRTH